MNENDFLTVIEDESDSLKKIELISQNFQNLLKQGKFKEIIESCNFFLENPKYNNVPEIMGFCYKELGLASFYLNDNKNSIKYNKLAFDYYSRNNNISEMMGVLNNITGVYFRNKEFSKCISYLNKGIDLLKDSDNKEPLIPIYSNLSYVYLTLKKYREAQSAIQSALKLSEELNIDKYKNTIYNNIAELYFLEKKTDLATRYIDYSIELAKKKQNDYDVVVASRIKANILSSAGLFSEAIDILLPAVEICEKNGYNEVITYLTFEIARFYEENKDFENSIKFYNKYLEVQKRFYNERLNKKTEKLEEEFDKVLNEKEKEIYKVRNDELEQAYKDLQVAYSELKKTEEEILKAERTNTVLQAAVTANHELNQPLMIIQGNIELIYKKSLDKENIGKYVSEITSDIEKINSILKKLPEYEVSEETLKEDHNLT